MDEVANIIGYNVQTINRWMINGTLRSAQIQGDVIVPGEWLVDFNCSKGYRMSGMCKKHKKLLLKFLEQ